MEKICEFYRDICKDSRNRKRNLQQMLFERQQELDDAFIWTPRKVSRLVCIGKKVEKCLEKMWDEVLRVREVSFGRMRRGGEVFLHDFEIRARIVPFIYSTNENGEWIENEGIFEILCDWAMDFALIGFANDSSLYFDRSLNWNSATPAFRCDELKGVYINYALHELSDHCYWSISDILSIDELWGEVVVTHQHFVGTI